MTVSLSANENEQSDIDALASVLTDLTALKTQFNQLRTDYAAHTHDGVTAGAAASGAPTAATTATAVTLNSAA